jgi:hypothetical protein
VLPLGADALLEHEEVSVWDYLRNHVDVVVHTPEVLNLDKWWGLILDV